MASSPLAAHGSSPAEIAARLEAARRGRPFLVYRDADGTQVVTELPDSVTRLTVGRRPACDLHIAWDDKVSRLHAGLERVGDDWTVTDDGLSHNGTSVNGERIRGQRRLSDRDLMSFGDTVVAFCDPRGDAVGATETAAAAAAARALSDADRATLEALCRPLLASPYAAPSPNADIAAELHLSLAAVKSRLWTLYQRFGVDELPQNQKRAALAATAVRAGLVGRD